MEDSSEEGEEGGGTEEELLPRSSGEGHSSLFPLRFTLALLF